MKTAINKLLKTNNNIFTITKRRLMINVNKNIQKNISTPVSTIKLFKNNNFNKKFSTAAAVNLDNNIINNQENKELINENKINSSEEYTIKLILPNFIKPTIKIAKNASFKDLSALIKKSFNFEQIEYRTWDHSVISLGNDLRSCMESGNLIFLRIDNFEWQLLNFDLISQENLDLFNNENEINFDLKNLSDTSDLTKYLELRIEQRFSALKEIIEEANKNKNLTADELDQIALDLFRIKKSIYINNEVSHFNLKEKSKANHLSDIMEQYYDCKSEIARYTSLHNKFENRAKSLAKIVIYLGGIFFIVELFLVYYFTFEVYAWDITEPMVYLMGCFNLIIIFWFKKKFKGQDALVYFQNLFLRLMMRKSKKIDFGKLEKLKKDVAEIERFMKR